MGDTLSQEELDALLGSLSDSDDLSPDSNSGDSGTPEQDTGTNTGQSAAEKDYSNLLTDEQKDVLGESGNISMGTSATTLYQLLGQRVLITTPKVRVLDLGTLAAGYERPCVGVRVNYTKGIEGSNVLILKQDDVKIITSFMMGGDGVSDVDGELSELDLSAIAEAMNQMIGSASTSLSSMIKIKIDIDTPVAFPLNFNDDSFLDELKFEEEELVAITFRMEIGTLIDSEITQILPLQFAKEMVEKMKSELIGAPTPEIKPAAPAAPPPAPAPLPAPAAVAQPQYMPPPAFSQPVNAQPVQFDTFGLNLGAQHKENIGLIMDVPLEVTVELGRTTKKIKEILEFSPGSTIIELNKLAGEPIDVLVNGKFVAKGEVVVIDENFAVRITDIVSVDKRI